MFEIIKNGYCIIKLHISWINSYNVRVFKKCMTQLTLINLPPNETVTNFTTIKSVVE